MKKNAIRENKGVLCVLGAVFLLMLALNGMSPLFADDYIYSLNLKSELPLNDFKDVVNSISGFRRMHNGRIVAHFFVQLFLWLPKPLFVVVNAGMFTALLALMLRFVRSGSKNKDALITVCAFAAVWLFMPGFGHAVLWRTGACSYLWAAVFLVAFIYPFFRAYMTGLKAETALSVAGGMVFAFFAGSYSESGAFSALAITFCFLALVVLKERKIPSALLLRFVAACAGFLWLMLAPSELGKKNIDSDSQTLAQLDKLGISFGYLAIALVALLLLALLFVWGLKKHRRIFCKAGALLFAFAIIAVAIYTVLGLGDTVGFTAKLNALFSETKFGLALLFGAYAMTWCLYMSAEEIDLTVVLGSLVMGLGALASLAVFLLADYFPARAACFTTVYLAIAEIMLVSGMNAKPQKILTILLLLATIPVLFAGVKDVANIYSQYRRRCEVIVQTQAAGVEELNLDPLVAEGRYGVVWQGEAFDYLEAMGWFYDIDTIIIEGAKYW